MATNENQAAAREKYTGKHCSANHGLCNCPNCATDNCTNADDTRLHGLAIAFMALLEASVKEGYDEQPLELAQVWIQQNALSGPVGEGAARLLGITLPQMNPEGLRTRHFVEGTQHPLVVAPNLPEK